MSQTFHISYNKQPGSHRVVFVLPKKLFPAAVVRNTIKRRIREALRASAPHDHRPIVVRGFKGAEQTPTGMFKEVFSLFFNTNLH